MKNEFFVVGIILVIVGVGISFYGYEQMQPTGLEKTVNTINKLGEALSGKQLPLPKRDNTVPVLVMILGGFSFVVGLRMIIKSGEQKASVSPPQRQDYFLYCSSCGVQISNRDKFCSKCGAKVES